MANLHKGFENTFSQLTGWVYDGKYRILGAILLVTATLAVHTPKLTIDTRDESFFHDNDPTLIAYNHFRDTFGQDDTFIIGMKPQHGINRKFLRRLHQLHQEIESAVPYLDEVTSLVNARIVRAEGDTLIVEELMKAPPDTDQEVEKILDLIERYPLYEKLLVSEDRSIVFLLVRAQAVIAIPTDPLEGFDTASPQAAEATTYLSNDQNMEINEAIHQIVATYQNQDIVFHFSGTPAFVAEIQAGIIKDLSIMVPLSFLVIIVFLLLLFRMLSGVVYPVITVALSLVSSLGIMAIAGIPISNAIQILPTFLIVVGIGDSVHILTIFYRNYRVMGDKRRAIIDAVGFAGLPVLMTSITTAAGLLSFASADVAIVAQLGYIAPVGVMLAFIYTIFLLPVLIAIFPVKRPKPVSQQHPLVDRIFDAIARLTTRRPMVVALIAACIMTGAGYSALSVRFSHNSLTWLPPDAPIRKSTEFLDRVNGGTVMLDVTIDSGIPGGMQNPDLLRRIDEATQHIPSITAHDIKAGKAVSMADLLKEINRALNGDKDDAYALPTTRKLTAQELLLFESSGSDDMEEITDSRYQISRLSILAPFVDAILYKDYVDEVESYLKQQLPEQNIYLTGHMVIFVQMIKRFITSMAKSYIIAMAIITLLMILLIGRIGIGLMSMVANIGPVLCVFGIMGIAKIPLDMATILIGSIVLGIVVDDTIHFLHRYRLQMSKLHDRQQALEQTFSYTGRAILQTTWILCLGLLPFALSSFLTVWMLGTYLVLTLICAVLGDLLLLPAMIKTGIMK